MKNWKIKLKKASLKRDDQLKDGGVWFAMNLFESSSPDLHGA